MRGLLVTGVDVHVELDELDRVVGDELPDDREPRDQNAGGDQDPIVGASGDERWELVEGGGEDFDDAEELEDLEVVGRRFAIGSALCRELAVEVFEERLVCADCSAFAGQG